MITLEDLLRDLVWLDERDEHLYDNTERRLHVERIRPEDLPKKDWPGPEPNKRVIIIDI